MARLGTAVAAASFATMLLAGVAGAQEAGCTVTVEPSSVAVGSNFTVSGNFGGAEIFLVKGANANPAEGAEPDATTPPGDSFSVVFTAEAADVGEWTVLALIPASECGDSAALTVTPAPSNTAVAAPVAPVMGIAVSILAIAGLLAGALITDRRRIA